MLRSHFTRLIAGAALLAGAAALHVVGASADPRIQIGVGGNGGRCPGNYWAEAIGRSVGSTIECQAWNQGGTTTAQCPFTVSRHQARITQRGPNGALVRVAASSPETTTWLSMSPSVSYTIPDCPGGGFFTAISIGKDVPGPLAP